MKLTELEPQFIVYREKMERGRFVKPGIDPARGNWTDDDFEERDHMQQSYHHVDTLAEAQGIMFLCPICFVKNAGSIGTHLCQVTFSGRGVLDHQGCHGTEDKPTRWEVSGSGYEDLTTKPSIQLLGGCNWHGFITNGEVT
jgi:hypothetical protein